MKTLSLFSLIIWSALLLLFQKIYSQTDKSGSIWLFSGEIEVFTTSPVKHTNDILTTAKPVLPIQIGKLAATPNEKKIELKVNKNKPAGSLKLSDINNAISRTEDIISAGLYQENTGDINYPMDKNRRIKATIETTTKISRNDNSLIKKYTNESKGEMAEKEKYVIVGLITSPHKDSPKINNYLISSLFTNKFFDEKSNLLINTNQLNYRDSIINPPSTQNSVANGKVVISNGGEGLEFTPLSSLNNGALIQPINRSNNKGISTALYLGDTTNWSFYTNSQQRLIINGDGKIVVNSSLLINNKDRDNTAFTVNGNARFDSSIILMDQSHNNTFISLNTNIKYAGTEPDDSISPYTLTPISWANGNNIPVFRLRHPNILAIDQYGVNTSVQKDFKIFPYQYGTAIEYNGIVECWVGEWSIHRGLQYNDTEGKGNGWGGVLWVGDDNDAGGVRATARNNSNSGGNVIYGELSVEKFSGVPNGDFRLRLPSTQNEFQFVYGERGSNNIYAKISDKGIVIPRISTVTDIETPVKAQLVYDSTDNQFKGFNGTEWKALTDKSIITGSSTLSASGSDHVYIIAHGQTILPSYFNVIATSADAANISYVTADSNNIYIHYTSAPIAGFVNLSWNWQIKK